MAVNGVVARIFENIAYTDGSNGTFGSSLDENSNIATTTGSAVEANELDNDKSTEINDAINLLSSTLAFSFAGVGNGKTVRDFVFEISGFITRDNGTNDSFSVQWTSQNEAFDADGDSITPWTEMVAEGTFNSTLIDWLETAVGSVVTL